MKKTIPLTINVFKECGTCCHICFLETGIDEPALAKCSLSNAIVTVDCETGIEYIDIDCAEWSFEKRLLDDSYYFLDLETSPVECTLKPDALEKEE